MMTITTVTVDLLSGVMVARYDQQKNHNVVQVMKYNVAQMIDDHTKINVDKQCVEMRI